MTSLTVALIQMRSGRRIAPNVESALAAIADAARKGAELILTPEMTTLLERDRDRFRAEMLANDTGAILAAFASAARTHGVFLLIGSMAVALKTGRFVNRSVLFTPQGDCASVYDKIHLFDVAVDGNNNWTESALYAPGADAVLVETPFATLGLSICYDLRFAALYRLLAQAGAQFSPCRLLSHAPQARHTGTRCYGHARLKPAALFWHPPKAARMKMAAKRTGTVS